MQYSKVTKLLIAITGVPFEIAKECIEDIPSIKNSGFQLILLYGLIVLLQGTAFSVLFHTPWGFALGASTALLIILFERSIFKADYIIEGKIELAKRTGKVGKTIKYSIERLFGLGIRMSIACGIALVVAHFAEAKIFAPEISVELVEMEREKYPIFVKKVDAYGRQLRGEISEDRDSLTAMKITLQKMTLDRSNIVGNYSNGNSTNEYYSQITELDNQYSETKIFLAKVNACQGSEFSGDRNPMCDEFNPSGLKGNGKVYDRLIKLAEVEQSKLNEIEAKMGRVRNRVELVEANEASNFKTSKHNLDGEIQSLQDNIKILEAEIEKKEASIGEKIGEFKTSLKPEGFEPLTERGGLANIFNALDRAKSNMSETAQKTSLMFAAFVVLLEMIAFLSRIFGATPSASLAIYAAILKRTNRLKKELEDDGVIL